MSNELLFSYSKMLCWDALPWTFPLPSLHSFTVTALPRQSPAQSPHPRSITPTRSVKSDCALSCHENPQHPYAHPLFSQTILKVGKYLMDSPLSWKIHFPGPETASLQPHSLSPWMSGQALGDAVLPAVLQHLSDWPLCAYLKPPYAIWLFLVPKAIT